MNEKQRVTIMWQQFIQGNERPNLEEFTRRVSNEFSCSLLEAQQKTTHLLLTE
jgi:hypothetical protein